MSFQVSGIGGFVAVGPNPFSGYGVPNGKGKLGQLYFDGSQSPPVQYTWNGISWVSSNSPSSLIVNGTISLNTTGTGTTTIGGSSGASTINVGAGNLAINGNGNTIGIGNDAAANTTTLGSTNTTSTTTINGGTGGIQLTGTNVNIATAGKFLQIKGATFAATNSIGVGTLAAGTTTIANTNIASGDVILLTRVGINGSTTLGVLTYSIIPATSFTVTSVILGTPASTQTGDTSTFAYIIVRPS